MKKTITKMALVFVLGSGIVHAAQDNNKDTLWQTDFEKAKKESAEKDQPILANFTGSDWCGWCIRLHKNVFSKKAFKKYARKNLVPLKVDFPREKKQPAEIKQQNRKLAKEYEIKGFPTILILNSKGEILARTGFQKGGPEKYVKHLKKLIKEADTPE